MTQRPRRIFVTGSTGYIGTRLIPALQASGHTVKALLREQSKDKLRGQCEAVIGNALDGDSYSSHVYGCDTFVHLVGVSHPSPAKAQLFREIDLKSGLEAIRVARECQVGHFIYISVAHPSPMMHSYIAVRAECERAIEDQGLCATILRPWYVLGPGHRWPYCLLPFYKVAELLPRTREGARRLGLISLRQMIRALLHAVEHPATATTVLEVPDIRAFGRP